MSFPKKKSRNITVNNYKYLWIARGNSNNEKSIDLSIMSSETNGQKFFAQFNYNTIDENAHKYANQFIITTSLVRQTIIYGLKKGYNSEKKEKGLNLGNLSNILDIKVSGKENIRVLLIKINNLSYSQFSNSEKDIILKNSLRKIIQDCNEYLLNEKWFLGFKIMIENLHKIKFKINNQILNLIKQIFKNENIDWKKEFYWISEFEIIIE